MITICHLEELPIVRKAIQLLSEEAGMIWYLSGSNDIDHIDNYLKNNRIDMLLIDIDTSRGNYRSTSDYFFYCSELHKKYPYMGIIIHSRFKNPGWMDKFRYAGVKGFVSKYSHGKEVIEAIKSLDSGKAFLCPLLMQTAANGKDAFFQNRFHRLLFSYREMQILQQLRLGKSTKQISAELNIAVKTVETHRKNLITKAKARNTAELIQVALELGY